MKLLSAFLIPIFFQDLECKLMLLRIVIGINMLETFLCLYLIFDSAIQVGNHFGTYLEFGTYQFGERMYL